MNIETLSGNWISDKDILCTYYEGDKFCCRMINGGIYEVMQHHDLIEYESYEKINRVIEALSLTKRWLSCELLKNEILR